MNFIQKKVIFNKAVLSMEKLAKCKTLWEAVGTEIVSVVNGNFTAGKITGKTVKLPVKW